MITPLDPDQIPSVVHLLRVRAEEAPNRGLLRFQGIEATYLEVEQRSNRIANALRARGITKGDRIGIMMPNSIEFPSVWLGIVKAGAVVVPLNISYQERDLTYLLTNSGARLVFAGADQASILLAVRPACPALEALLTLGTGTPGASGVIDLRSELTGASTACPIDSVRRSDLVTLQYTSGTTGFPKGCMLTHQYWLFLGTYAARASDLGPDDIILTTTPFYYMDPTWNLVMALFCGAKLVILPKFSPSSFWRTVQEERITFFYCLGTMPVFLLKQPENPELEHGHRVKHVICSGIVPQLHAEFERRWGVPWREAYGTTEFGPPISVSREDTGSVGSGSMGVVLKEYELRVVNDHGHDVPDGEVGELIGRGPGMMTGYWMMPEATAAWMRDGWAHTGDLVRRDSRGYYYLIGRLKDMIRRAGENIAAVEVEGVLAEHPAVSAAACVPVPDDLRGEEVKAFIVLQPGHTRETTPPESILAFARTKLAAFKLPRYVEYVDRFPLTPSERVEKHKLLAEKPDQRIGAFDATTKTWN